MANLDERLTAALGRKQSSEQARRDAEVAAAARETDQAAARQQAARDWAAAQTVLTGAVAAINAKLVSAGLRVQQTANQDDDEGVGLAYFYLRLIERSQMPLSIYLRVNVSAYGLIQASYVSNTTVPAGQFEAKDATPQKFTELLVGLVERAFPGK